MDNRELIEKARQWMRDCSVNGYTETLCKALEEAEADKQKALDAEREDILLVLHSRLLGPHPDEIVAAKERGYRAVLGTFTYDEGQ